MKKDKLKKEVNNSKELEYYKIYPDEKPHTFLKVILVLIILVVCGVLFYKFVVWNNKGIFSTGINSVYKYLNKSIDKLDDYNILDSGNELDGVISFNTNDSDLKELTNYQYDVNAKMDIKSKKVSGSFNILNDSDSIFNVEYRYQNSKQYINLKNIYDHIINLNGNNEYLDKLLDKGKELNYDKLNISIKSINDIINNNIESNNLVNGDETVSINNNDYNLKYVSLKLSKEEYGKLITNIKNDMEDNHQLITNLAEAFNSSESDVNDYLNELLKNALVSDFENIEIKVYVDGIMASIKGMQVIVDDSEIVKVIMIDDNKLVSIKSDTYEINYLNDAITIIDNDKEVLTGSINKFDDNLFDMDYTTYVNEKKYYGNIHIDATKESDDKIHGKISFSLVTSDSINYSIELDYSLYSNITIEDINEDDVISINNVSEDDYLEMYNKLDKNTKGTIYNKLITSMSESLLNY